jgi:hypothetical protein
MKKSVAGRMAILGPAGKSSLQTTLNYAVGALLNAEARHMPLARHPIPTAQPQPDSL